MPTAELPAATQVSPIRGVDAPSTKEALLEIASNLVNMSA
ncbi:hypothetical protein G9444_6552 (plasmid) [Rhodococcus erythropolis]|jgi:hypothetical protein|uniref:Uncharacterized protein n=1 Tax=Rhodococcus erythropolis TaxID=1833 RepID=A0A6G9D3D0_RHOER|nr:hypothetical protein N601_30525 [Rhodococcus erythropolis DN1]QIP43795.1 hypothetical protein G9444_6552 [Rhodococcus erythropolis]